MARSQHIINILKQELKLRRINYKQLAKKLELSEATIKHMFASKNFSLKRLDKICDILDLEISDLIAIANTKTPKIAQLSLEDEKKLVSDAELLLVAYCVTNHWHIDDILNAYSLSETECVRCLAQLDRMKMIELLPQNRIRLLISNNFKWHRNGPIEQFFRKQVQQRFFNGAFSGDDKLHMVKIGDLSDKSVMQIIERLNNIGNVYDELTQEDRKQPFDKRYGTTMVLAIKKWEFQAFRQFEKRADQNIK